MTGVASTIWAQLAGLNAAAGSIVYLGSDSATPVLDAANLNYDQVLKHQYIGFAYNPAYTRYGSTDVAGLSVEKMIDSYVATPLQSTYGGNAEHAVTSSQGSAQVPQFSTAGDLLGIFSGRGYASVNPGSVQPLFTRLADIEMYADGGIVPVVGNVGGQIQIKTKANGGVLTTAMTIKQDQSVTIAGALTVIGALVFAGGISATMFTTTTQAITIPVAGIYSDTANTVDIAGNSIKLASFGPATITFTQPLTTPGLTSTGAVALSPANVNVVLSPTGTGIVTINPSTAGTLNNVSLGATTPLAVTSTALTATGTVTLSPANLNVVLSPTGTGVVTINPATAGTINNVSIGATTAAAGKFTGLTSPSLTTASGNLTVSSTGGTTSLTDATVALTGVLTTPGTNVFTAPAGGTALQINGRSSDNQSVILFASNGGGSQYGTIVGTSTLLTVNHILGSVSLLGTNAEQCRIIGLASAAHYMTITGSVAGNPIIGASAGSVQIGTNLLVVGNATATPAGGTAGLGIQFGGTANLGIFYGSGLPTLSAAQGSVYIRSDGSSTTTRLYINTTGATAWTNVATAA